MKSGLFPKCGKKGHEEPLPTPKKKEKKKVIMLCIWWDWKMEEHSAIRTLSVIPDVEFRQVFF